MPNEKFIQNMSLFMKEYQEIVKLGLDERWQKIPLKLYDSEVYEVIGGLLARQATLSLELAKNPSIWNGHVAPLILRSMIDAHITLAWILKNDFEKRAREYILYGLGQEKKLIEHLKNAKEEDEDLKEIIKLKEKWIELQQYPWLTDVNLGSWSGINTRQMAIETNCEDLYKFSFEPFSAVAHNMWQHISIYNLKQCTNPLHKYHKVPTILKAPLSEDFVYRSSKYISKSFIVFDEKFKLTMDTPLPEDWFIDNIEKVYNDKMSNKF